MSKTAVRVPKENPCCGVENPTAMLILSTWNISHFCPSSVVTTQGAKKNGGSTDLSGGNISEIGEIFRTH